MYRDSVELDEVKQPIEIKSLRLVEDSAGPGRYRGGPQGEIVFGPKRDPMTIAVVCDGQINPPRGVRGGGPGAAAGSWRISANGNETKLPNLFLETFHPGEYVRGTDNGGGGYGDPLERDPERVAEGFREGWISRERVAAYGVVLKTGDDGIFVDTAATAKLKASMGKTHGV